MMYPFDVIGTMHVIRVVIALFNEFPVVFGKKNLACIECVVSTISGPIGDVMLWKWIIVPLCYCMNFRFSPVIIVCHDHTILLQSLDIIQ